MALGIAHLTLGSDTGGSTRIPAAFNGIVGFKPTTRRIPRDGAFPLSYTLDSIGPLGRTVAACAAMDAVLAGEDAGPLTEVPLAGLRIGVPRGLMFEDTDSEVARAFEFGLASLGAKGAQIRDLPIDDLVIEMRAALGSAPIVACEAAEIHAGHIATHPKEFDRRVLARILPGQGVPAHAYIHALNRREALKPRFQARMADVDLLVLPTCAIRAPLIAPLEADDGLFAKTNVLALRNTSAFNFFDCPALSLPLPISGLPAGVMLVGAPMSDRRLFSIGAAVERVLKG